MSSRAMTAQSHRRKRLEYTWRGLQVTPHSQISNAADQEHLDVRNDADKGGKGSY
jgi:hypothetical protein